MAHYALGIGELAAYVGRKLDRIRDLERKCHGLPLDSPAWHDACALCRAAKRDFMITDWDALRELAERLAELEGFPREGVPRRPPAPEKTLRPQPHAKGQTA